MSRQFAASTRLAAIALALVTGTACSGAGASPSPRASSSPPAAVTRPEVSANPTVTPTATLAACGPARDIGALHVVTRFAVSPDDITVDGSGRLWVTALDANLLIGMDATGAAMTTQTVPGGPEGVAADGSTLYIAQQTLNAVVTLAPTARTLVRLPNRTTNLGIDGIAVDAATHRLLVPDSPTGQLFAIPLTGLAAPALLASGLGRPVAATADVAGDVIVASENSPGLTVVTPAGATRPLGHFTDLDEVVGYAGLLYVAELDHRDVLAVDPSTGASVPVAVNLPAPQGLTVTASGTLEIVDATTNTLYSTPACGAGA